MHPAASDEYREIYRNRYLRGILISPFLTSVGYTVGACMLVVLGCLFVWLIIGLLGKWAGSLADAWALAQQSPGKAFSLAALTLLLAVLGVVSVPLGLSMMIYAWWSYALVVVSRFYVLFGLPLASAEGLPTFYYRRRRVRQDTFWIKQYIVHRVEIGGLRFRLDELVTSKLPEGRKALRMNYPGWTRTLSESDSSRVERIEVPVRAWYVPSTRLLVSIEWPVWAELRKLDLLEQSYAELLRAHPEANTPREQARIQEFYRKLQSFRISLQPGVPEEIRQKAEEALDLLAFCMEWGVDPLKKRATQGKR